MGIYRDAMLKVPCYSRKCEAAIGQRCTSTSAIVHPIRRRTAIAEGHWDPVKALAGEYGSLAGEPLEAIKQ
jgi:hypothetical protein